MSYAITQKQSESPSSSLVGPWPVFMVPLGVASTLSQSAPEKSSEDAWSTARQTQPPYHARLQDHGQASSVFPNEEVQLPPPPPPPLPLHQSHHLHHRHQHPNPTPPGFRPHFLPPPQSVFALHWAASITQWWHVRQQNKTKVNRPIRSEAE